MHKPVRPVYTDTGAIFLEGPWAEATYLPDGSVELVYAARPDMVKVLNRREGTDFKQIIGDRRARDRN